jgi:hypothetical protein
MQEDSALRFVQLTEHASGIKCLATSPAESPASPNPAFVVPRDHREVEGSSLCAGMGVC